MKVPFLCFLASQSKPVQGTISRIMTRNTTLGAYLDRLLVGELGCYLLRL